MLASMSYMSISFWWLLYLLSMTRRNVNILNVFDVSFEPLLKNGWGKMIEI